jgi:hypothetical protein
MVRFADIKLHSQFVINNSRWFKISRQSGNLMFKDKRNGAWYWTGNFSSFGKDERVIPVSVDY